MPFAIIRNDITKLKVDAIVNAANNNLLHGGGVCGIIFEAAGAAKLQKACSKLKRCATGEAVITKGYSLPAKYIIHTVGPVWHGGDAGERDLLYSCYKKSLELAKSKNCESAAFPLISSGLYGYPKDQALQIAVAAIGDFLLQNDMAVFLVVFDKAAFTLSEKLHFAIQSFIDDHYAETYFQSRREFEQSVTLNQITEPLESSGTLNTQVLEDINIDECCKMECTSEARSKTLKHSIAPASSKGSYSHSPLIINKEQPELDEVLLHLEETFSQRLLRLIDEKKLTDSYVYKRANIDRRLFSKIRSKSDYKPSKNTALAFAIALELTVEDTKDLLMKAGYSLSRSNKMDVIVEYFIKKGNYNIFEINEALFAFDQSLLGT